MKIEPRMKQSIQFDIQLRGAFGTCVFTGVFPTQSARQAFVEQLEAIGWRELGASERVFTRQEARTIFEEGVGHGLAGGGETDAAFEQVIQQSEPA